MKKLFFFLFMGLYSVSVTQGQASKQEKVNPPVSVLAAFEKSFPGSSKLNWEKEGVNFEANFQQNGKSGSVIYDESGVLKETEWQIPVSDLPKGAVEYLNTNYKGAKIKEAAKIIKADGSISYEAEVNGKDLIFDPSGKFLKQE